MILLQPRRAPSVHTSDDDEPFGAQFKLLQWGQARDSGQQARGGVMTLST
jgi:hypothetical protein